MKYVTIINLRDTRVRKGKRISWISSIQRPWEPLLSIKNVSTGESPSLRTTEQSKPGHGEKAAVKPGDGKTRAAGAPGGIKKQQRITKPPQNPYRIW